MILQGDCLQVLPTLDERSVQTCVTSPPYYGLRSYVDNDSPDKPLEIGLEVTPEAYVEKLVAVFREVRRVLKDDGTLWLNLGDSYASANPCDRRNVIGNGSPDEKMQRKSRLIGGLKEKDLMGIPWMVAFALRADGWYLRSDIIWHKPNPMPESVTDRPTKSHEYIFLLSKSATYFYDAEAILEPLANSSIGRMDYPRYAENSKGMAGQYAVQSPEYGKPKTMKNLEPDGQQPNTMHLRRAEGLPDNEYPARNKRTVWTIDEDEYMQFLEWKAMQPKNKNDVWTVSTKPYKGSHFAVFPPDLIEPCILAGSRVGDVVLDPFNGSGTTGSVAIKHHRDYIGIELNPDYITLSEKRLSRTQYIMPGVQ